jgi:crotonobetainyl-CoA:carnitine CoA-transferase CaiB-like acyl-CoA transferase
MMADPQVLAREMIVEKEHPTAGLLKFTGIPIKFSETPGKITYLPPMKGEHTKAILGELGYTSDQIDNFEKRNII